MKVSEKKVVSEHEGIRFLHNTYNILLSYMVSHLHMHYFL